MLSAQEIKKFISDDAASNKKQFAKLGQRYYDSEHDIRNSRFFYFNADGNLVEDTTRANIKISHAFFMELADQLVSYMLSGDENPIRANENAEGLQDHLDRYFDDAFWGEMESVVLGAYVKGFDYVYGYKNAENRLTFQNADALGVVEVREKDTDDGCKYYIYYYTDRIEKGRKEIRRIQVWSEKEVYFYVQSGDGMPELDKSEPYNPRPHVIYPENKTCAPLGFIPFWRMDNNRRQISGLKPIKEHIDDYDVHACAMSNNLVDFDKPLYVVSGYEGNDLNELQQNLKTKRLVGTDSDGGIDIKTVDIPYEARKAKLEIDEKNIYRFGMGFNSAQPGDGNITNVVIRSRYTLLDLKANKTLKSLKKLLREILKVVLDEINRENGTDFAQSDIYFDFKPNIPTNEQENAQIKQLEANTRQIEVNTILNIAANVGDEQTLRALCEVMEWDFKEIKGHLDRTDEGQNTANAKNTLAGVIPDDATNPQNNNAPTEPGNNEPLPGA